MGNRPLKQEERRLRSHEYIIQSAQQAFGNYGYAGTSMGQICLEYRISKGRMYHYFISKDDLFLACAKEFFQTMNAWISDEFSDCFSLLPVQKLQAYFMCHVKYFQLHYERFELYKTFTICPPEHLKKDIMELYRPLADRNHGILKSVLLETNLRDSVSLDIAITYVSGVIWSYLIKLFREWNPEMNGSELENSIQKITDMIFFGIQAKTE